MTKRKTAKDIGHGTYAIPVTYGVNPLHSSKKTPIWSVGSYVTSRSDGLGGTIERIEVFGRGMLVKWEDGQTYWAQSESLHLNDASNA